MNEKYKKLLTDTCLFTISNFGSKILTFLLLPLYTSILSTQEYGTTDILITTVNLLYPILTLSIYDANLRFGLDKKYDYRKVFSASILLTILAIIILLLMTPFTRTMDNIFGHYWWFFVGVFVSTTFQMCLSNYVKSREKTKIFAIQGILYTFVFLVLNIYFLVYLKIGIRGYLLSTIIAGCTSSIYMLIAAKCYCALIPFIVDKNIVIEMLRYSVPMVPTSVAWWVNASADKYMILGMIGVSANGLYGIAHKIPTIFSTVSNLFSQAWRISAISNYDEKNKQEYYSQIYRKYSLMCIYACMILITMSQLLAKILFRSEYYEAWKFVPSLILAALFEAYAGFLASLYAAAKRTKILSISTCLGAVVNIVLNYACIKMLGAIGAPIATMLSFVVVWLIRLSILNKFMPVVIDAKQSVITIPIVIISCLYFSFQGPLYYCFQIVAIITIFLVNRKETISIFVFIRKLVMRRK